MRQAQLQLGGLGDDSGIGTELLEHRLHANAGLLLVGHGHHQNVTRQLAVHIAQ